MIQDVCFSNSTAISIPQMLALVTFSFQRSPWRPSHGTLLFSLSTGWHRSQFLLGEIQQKILMEEDNTQGEEPKQEGAADVHTGKNSPCALHSRRLSINIYQYLLSSMPTGNDLAFSSVNEKSSKHEKNSRRLAILA